MDVVVQAVHAGGPIDATSLPPLGTVDTQSSENSATTGEGASENRGLLTSGLSAAVPKGTSKFVSETIRG